MTNGLRWMARLGHWWRARTSRGQAPAPADDLSDLRAQLPAEFGDADPADVARLWLAWEAARNGHPAHYLVDTAGVSEDIATTMERLAHPNCTDG